MELQQTYEFLHAAVVEAKVHDYFHWRVVGKRLGWPERKSLLAIELLRDHAAAISVRGDEARLLPAGRLLAEKLAGVGAGAQPRPSLSSSADSAAH